jgi:hypothetical protein
MRNLCQGGAHWSQQTLKVLETQEGAWTAPAGQDKDRGIPVGVSVGLEDPESRV